MNEDLENLTLLLIYLTAWDENPKRELGNKPLLRAWKGYEWDVLDALREKGYIRFKRGWKSVYLTEEGIKRAEELKWRLLKK